MILTGWARTAHRAVAHASGRGAYIRAGRGELRGHGGMPREAALVGLLKRSPASKICRGGCSPALHALWHSSATSTKVISGGGEACKQASPKESGTAEVRLSGRFDFNAHRDFRNAYEPPLMAESDIRAVTIDMGGRVSRQFGVGHVADAARQGWCREQGADIDQCPRARETGVEIANFGKLFRIA